MKFNVDFDSSLTLFVRTLLGTLDKDIVLLGWFLRDASGHLTFISRVILDAEIVNTLEANLQNAMDGYCRDGCVLDIGFPGVERIISESSVFREEIRLNDKKNDQSTLEICLIDRRLVGHDWLTEPVGAWKDPEPARLVFASLKGGVGRSTSLVVLAVELSRKGKKVLAVDLDLEAPGIGTMLLNQTSQPKYGALDWYVERGIHGAQIKSDDLVTKMIGVSHFSSNNGLIHVVPAVGTNAENYPSNVLSKISRAYIESPNENAKPVGFLHKTQELIAKLSEINRYDVILIDARAGLNESTAASLLGLGADVLLFGIDTPQTFASYRFLLSHLAKFARDEKDDWLYRFRMVHAKASRDSDLQTIFRDRAHDIFKELLYKDVPLVDDVGNLLRDDMGLPLSPKKEFGLSDIDAPHYAWTVLTDANFAEFDPCAKDSQLKPEFYGETYAGLIAGIDGLMGGVGGST
jgi:hypothetical protein